MFVGGGSGCDGGASGNNGGWGFWRLFLLDNAKILVVAAIPFMPTELMSYGKVHKTDQNLENLEKQLPPLILIEKTIKMEILEIKNWPKSKIYLVFVLMVIYHVIETSTLLYLESQIKNETTTSID